LHRAGRQRPIAAPQSPPGQPQTLHRQNQQFRPIKQHRGSLHQSELAGTVEVIPRSLESHATGF
jgi:hypothetical protein